MNRNIKDIGNLLRKNLKPLRILNALKVISSYYLSRIIKKPVHWGLPVSFSIEPTTSCNLRCPQCPSGLRNFSRPTGMLQSDVFSMAIESLYKYSGYITFYFQGEPYLNTNFTDMVSEASRRGMYSATSTNAHYLNKENAENTVKSGLDRLIISIDGTTQETYGKYRIGGKLEKVLEGTREIVEAKKRLKSSTPHIIWQFIVFSHNEHQINEIRKLSKAYNVDELAIKSAQIYDYESGNDMIPKNEKYSRYSSDGELFRFKNRLYNHCWRLWNSCVITWDGTVVPCCFDKDGSHKMGNLKSETFHSIWKGPAYLNFRKQIIKGRQYIDICKNCSEGTSVWSD